MSKRLDFLIITALCIFFGNASARAQGWQSFRSDTGWISFSYPSGWDVIATDRTPSRFLENYAIQPKGQNFSGYPGQIALRIFDPMFVVEQARVRSLNDKSAVFQQFVRSLPGVRSPTFGSRVFAGVTYLFASDRTEQMETDYAAFVNQAGDLDVVAMASNPAEASGWQSLLFQITGSMRTSPTAGSVDAASNVVRSWYSNLRIGNMPALAVLSCRQAVPSMLLLYFASPDIVRIMSRAALSFDMTGLRFQTVKSGALGAAVRVSGNLVAPNGSVVPTFENSSLFGGSNTLFVKYEEGEWHVCGPVRGGYR